MKKLRFNVTGMTCSACSSRLEKALKKLDGISDLSVNLLTETMTCKIDEEKLGQADLIEAVTKVGYGISPGQEACEPVRQIEASRLEGDGDNLTAELKRLLISLAIMLPMMVLAMGPMLGLPVPANTVMLRTILQFVMLLPILFLNRHFFVGGLTSLWQLNPNMDSLIAVGSGACTIYGLYIMFRMAYLFESGSDLEAVELSKLLYFESAAMVPVLVSLGKYFENKSKKKTSRAIEALMDLVPDKAIVVRKGLELEIPVQEIRPGDIVSIKPGMRIPVDGIVESGYTSVDESVVTGESMPVGKGKGDTVISASQNQNGHIFMEATKVGQDTTIAKIIELVEEASSSKAPIAGLADKIAGVFVPIVIAISILVLAAWLLAGYGMSTALNFAVSVLVISCPCALGLATPVAIMVGTGKGAELGILIKSGEALETLHRVDRVLFDKTGTLTRGKPYVAEVISFDEAYKQEEIVRLVAGLEKYSEHPLAKAITDYAEKAQISLARAEDVQAIPGKGLVGKVEDRQLLVGNRDLLVDEGVALLKAGAKERDLWKEGRTQVLVAVDSRLVGALAIMDLPKPEAAEVIRGLHAMGIKSAMLTGDNRRSAQAIGEEIGIDQLFSQVLPGDKERYVRKLQDQGDLVAMVGDGINDGPALARADVGIAIGAGTEVALESADIVLTGNSLAPILSSISLSKAVIRNIKQNLFWAFLYNLLLIPLAAGLLFLPFGLKLNPMIAAAAMSLSSICVVSNALRLRRFKAPELSRFEKSSCRLKGRPGQLEDEPNLGEKFIDGRREKGERKMVDQVYEVRGMMCSHCEATVERLLTELGASDVLASHSENKVSFKVQEGQADDGRYKEAIRKAGYEIK